MISLGIDPDTKNIGLCLCDTSSVIGVSLITQPNIQNKRRVTKELNTTHFVKKIPEGLLDFVSQTDVADPTVIVIESQEISLGRQATPQNIIYLAQVAGAIAQACSTIFPSSEILMPKASAWKGTVPKAVHQKRLLKELGWEFTPGLRDLPVPIEAEALTLVCHDKLRGANWSHAIDAIGLARWGIKRYVP